MGKNNKEDTKSNLSCEKGNARTLLRMGRRGREEIPKRSARRKNQKEKRPSPRIEKRMKIRPSKSEKSRKRN